MKEFLLMQVGPFCAAVAVFSTIIVAARFALGGA